MWLIKVQCNYPLYPLADQLQYSWVTLSRYDWLLQGSSTYIFGIKLLISELCFPTMLGFSLACVNFPLHNCNQSIEASFGIAILSEAPWDNSWWESGCIVPHVLAQSSYYLTTEFRRRANFYKNSSSLSICFVIAAEGFLQQPNLEWSKGYQCNHTAQTANEINPTASQLCLSLVALSH